MDAETGQMLAMLEGGTLTAIRTGAGAGAGTDLLSRPDSKTAAIFGAGVQARTQLEAACSVREIETAWVYDPAPEMVEKFIAEMAGQGPIPKDLRSATSQKKRCRMLEMDVIADLGDVVEPNAGLRAAVGLGIGRGDAAQRGDAVAAGKRIVAVAAAHVILQLTQPVGLNEPDQWMKTCHATVLVGVRRNGGVDVPHEQARARQIAVETGPLPVLDDDRLPQAVHVVLDAVDPPHFRGGFDDQSVDVGIEHRGVHESQEPLAPGIEVRGLRTASVPGAARHDRPTSDARTRAIAIVEVGKSEHMAELVREHAHRGLVEALQLRLGGIAHDVDGVVRGHHPTVEVAPDVVGVAGGLGAPPRVHQKHPRTLLPPFR